MSVDNVSTLDSGGSTGPQGPAGSAGPQGPAGSSESWDYALSDETTLPTTGVKITDGIPYDWTITGVQVNLTTAGTGANLVRVDVLYEDGINANTFTTIFSTKPTVDASEFTTETAATPAVLSVTSIVKGRRIQYKIDQIDSNNLVRGIKVILKGHPT